MGGNITGQALQRRGSALDNTFGGNAGAYKSSLPWENGGGASGGAWDSLLGGDMNLGKGMDMFGQGMGIFGDIMGMMNQKKMMEAGITGLNNQTKTGNYNMANNTNFTNGTINAFGSGQAKAQNQFGSMV